VYLLARIVFANQFTTHGINSTKISVKSWILHGTSPKISTYLQTILIHPPQLQRR